MAIINKCDAEERERVQDELNKHFKDHDSIERYKKELKTIKKTKKDSYDVMPTTLGISEGSPFNPPSPPPIPTLVATPRMGNEEQKSLEESVTKAQKLADSVLGLVTNNKTNG